MRHILKRKVKTSAQLLRQKLSSSLRGGRQWSGRLDLNQRPHAPQACALPGCATSRRPAPISVSLAFEKGQDSQEFLVQIEEEFAMRARCRFAAGVRGGRFRARFALDRRRVSAAVPTGKICKMLAGTGDGETFFVEQAFDFKNGFDVVAAVEAMSAGTFHRLQRREFRLPVAQDEGLRGRQTAHFADAEKALLWKFGRGRISVILLFSVSSCYEL